MKCNLIYEKDVINAFHRLPRLFTSRIPAKANKHPLKLFVKMDLGVVLYLMINLKRSAVYNSLQKYV